MYEDAGVDVSADSVFICFFHKLLGIIISQRRRNGRTDKRTIYFCMKNKIPSLQILKIKLFFFTGVYISFLIFALKSKL